MQAAMIVSCCQLTRVARWSTATRMAIRMLAMKVSLPRFTNRPTLRPSHRASCRMRGLYPRSLSPAAWVRALTAGVLVAQTGSGRGAHGGHLAGAPPAGVPARRRNSADR
jgi:hypothetical protein